MKSLIKDLVLAFLWAIVITMVICAPGVFDITTKFVYTIF